MVSNPFIHIRVIQCYNWRIYELSNSKSNYHSDTSYEPQSTGQQGLLQAWSVLCQPNSGPPKCSHGTPNHVLQKSYVTLHLETEWPSNQNILTADTILAEPGPYPGFKVWGGKYIFKERRLLFILYA